MKITMQFVNDVIDVSNVLWSTSHDGFYIHNINDKYKPKTYDFYINTHIRSLFHEKRQPQSPALVNELKKRLNQKLGNASTCVDKYKELIKFITECYEPDSMVLSQNHVVISLVYHYAEELPNFENMTMAELLDKIAIRAVQHKREITKEWGVNPLLSEKIFPTITTKDMIDIFENGGGNYLENQYIDNLEKAVGIVVH